MTTRFQLGHTAYHHLGQLPGDCVRGGSPYKPTPSAPYYQFGYQRRYPYAWSGAAGGVPQSRVAAESRGLGIFDLRESGLAPSPQAFNTFPGFRKTMIHEGYVSSGDFPLVRPAGREPDDPRGDGRGGLGLSDNEKKFGLVLAVGAIGFFALRRMRKNPARKRYEVRATSSPRGRRLEYAGSFTKKGDAERYAGYLRRGGHRAHVRAHVRRR